MTIWWIIGIVVYCIVVYCIVVYCIVGFIIHSACLKLKEEDDDPVWDGVDKNSWPVELAFLCCAVFWPIVLIISLMKKEK